MQHTNVFKGSTLWNDGTLLLCEHITNDLESTFSDDHESTHALLYIYNGVLVLNFMTIVYKLNYYKWIFSGLKICYETRFDEELNFKLIFRFHFFFFVINKRIPRINSFAMQAYISVQLFLKGTQNSPKNICYIWLL